MNTIRILANSSDKAISMLLSDHLLPEQYEVIFSVPSKEFVQSVQEYNPQILICDLVNDPDSVNEDSIVAVKNIFPDIKIIVISDGRSIKDAEIVKQGIFYYYTAPVGMELVQVINAAAQSLIKKSGFRESFPDKNEEGLL